MNPGLSSQELSPSTVHYDSPARTLVLTLSRCLSNQTEIFFGWFKKPGFKEYHYTATESRLEVAEGWGLVEAERVNGSRISL